MERYIIIVLLTLGIHQVFGQPLSKDRIDGVKVLSPGLSLDSSRWRGRTVSMDRSLLIKQPEISLDLSESDDIRRFVGGLDLEACHTLRLSGCMYVNELYLLKRFFPKLKELDMSRLKLKIPPVIGLASTVPVTSTYQAHSLPSRCFEGHRYIERVTLPDTITRIESFAFSRCVRLRKVIFSDALQQIDSYAFINCKNLEFTIPDSVTNLGYYSFAWCPFPKTLKLPQELSFIEETGWTNVERYVISEKNRRYCTVDGLLLSKNKGYLVLMPEEMKKLSLPKEVTVIGYQSLALCRLRKIVLPESIVEVESEAFSPDLCELELPDNSDFALSDGAFTRCRNLKRIVCRSAKPYKNGAEVLGDLPRNCVIRVPKGAKKAYMQAEGWQKYRIKEM